MALFSRKWTTLSGVMVEGDLQLDRCLIAVGDLGPTAAGDLARLAGEYEIGLAGCADSYTAVAELAAKPGRSTLVVGRLAELTRDHAAFFSIAARNGARCCCVRKPDGLADHEEVLAALQAGAYLVSGNGDLVAAVKSWLAAEMRRAEMQAAPRPASGEDEFRTTDAELSALLGPETDD
jgi:hypothetical protein